MKNSSALTLFIFILLQLRCTIEQKIEAYNITPFLEAKVKLAESNGQRVKLELCKTTSFKWDKIVIIPSYTTKKMFRKYKFKNSKEIEKQLPILVSDENQVLLLFIHRNNIMKYSLVPVLPLNFNVINSSDVNKVLSREIVCEQLYIQKVNENLTLFYN